jgi:hypothetical protein
MPQIVRNLSAQTRKVEKLTSCFESEFVRKSVRRDKAYKRVGLVECGILNTEKHQVYRISSDF